MKKYKFTIQYEGSVEILANNMDEAVENFLETLPDSIKESTQIESVDKERNE